MEMFWCGFGSVGGDDPLLFMVLSSWEVVLWCVFALPVSIITRSFMSHSLLVLWLHVSAVSGYNIVSLLVLPSLGMGMGFGFLPMLFCLLNVKTN